MEHTLHMYQILAKNQILLKDKVLLEFRKGMGKKSIVAMAVRELLEKKEINKVLILVRSLYKIDKWMNELRLLGYNNLNIEKIQGKSSGKFIYHDAANVYITHRENIKWLTENEFMFDMVVLDEIDLFCNSKSLRYKKMLDICTSVKRIVGIMEHKKNIEYKLWDIMYLLDRGKRLGKIKAGYWDRFFFSYVDRKYRTIHRELKQNSTKSIYNILMDVVVNEDTVGIEHIPRNLYIGTMIDLDVVEMSKYMFLMRNNAEINELKQLANGCIEIKGRRFVLHNKKICELMSICEDCDDDIVIVYQYESDLQYIKENIMNIKVIQSMNDIQKWNEGQFKCIAIYVEFGGIDNIYKLRGDRVIWYSLPEKFKEYINMNKRFQIRDKKCLIIHNLVVKDTIDEITYETIEQV